MSKDELEEYLDALDRNECYRTDAILKDSPTERTERVFYAGHNGSELGPFIRKTITNDRGQGQVYEKLFRAQRRGKRLAHVPHIHECYTTDTSLVVLLEYVEGETLQEHIVKRGRSRVFLQRVFPLLCDAVIELHEAFDPPIIHRDLTPANAIFSADGVTLIDFGIARVFSPNTDHDTAYFGTRAYAPPEQFGFGQTDIRSDVYAMGKVLDYCLDDQTKTSNPEIMQIIEKATSFDPAMRYASVQDLKHAFLDAFDMAEEELQFVLPRESSEQPMPAAVLPEPDAAQRYEQAISSQSRSFSADPLKKSAPISSVPSRVTGCPHKKNSSVSLFSRIPLALGVVWNIAVLLVWLIFLAASITVVAFPEGDPSQLPLWLWALEVFGIVFIPLTILDFYLLDLRLIRQRFPKLKMPSRRKTWYFAPAVVIALWVIVYLIAFATGYTTVTPT